MSILSKINDAIKEIGKPQQIPELLLTDLEIGKITPEIAQVLDKCKKIEVLELSSCRLESLDNLPVFAKIKCIDLNDNKLTDKDLATIGKMKSLTQVFLENNAIEKIESLSPLQDLKELERLELANNPIQKLDGYREKVLEMLPDLQILDEKDRDGNELESEQPEGEDDEEGSEYDEPSDEEDDSAYSEDFDSEDEKPTKKRKGK